jgi:dethiobiotin synthetase
LEPAGLVIGAWPADPGLAERCNVDDLPHHTGLPVLATIPDGAGSLDREAFLAQSPGWFA